MKKIILFSTLAIVLLLSSFTIVDPADWIIKDTYAIRFAGRGIKNGFFHKMTGKIRFDENKPANSQINLEVEVRTLTTGMTLKSWRSKKRKWFNAKEYPTISFTSTKVQKATKGYVATGKIKMKGVEKEVTVPFSFSDKTFFGQFKVRRTDFKVGKYKGLKLVSDTIVIDFTIPVTK